MTTSTVTTAAPTSVLLRNVAHARAGDKGNSSILLLRPYRADDFRWLSEALTVSVLAQHFCTEPKHVIITAVPKLSTVTVVLRNQLAGGVTRSLRVDPHGKTLSGHLLDLTLPRPSD